MYGGQQERAVRGGAIRDAGCAVRGEKLPFAVAPAVGLRPHLPGRDRGQPFRRLVGVGITPFTVLPGAVRPASGGLHKADEPERSGRRPLRFAWRGSERSGERLRPGVQHLAFQAPPKGGTALVSHSLSL